VENAFQPAFVIAPRGRAFSPLGLIIFVASHIFLLPIAITQNYPSLLFIEFAEVISLNAFYNKVIGDPRNHRLLS
jgi:hypothetical protein